MADYAIYLRKSRADMEAEARGEGETLERHRTALRALAERRGLNVVQEYSELVTGDSIAARPQMQLLLDDVKRGLYAGVIVNDVDRLGRGDSIDQEIIKYAFVAGHCLIITPGRDINPAAPSDEDMLDFSMFFARFEYRKIKQRLMQGRTRSAASGNYISPRVPYGYKKVTNGKHITIEPAETADVVRMIFEWYASGKYGCYAIASRLNEMGLRTYLGNPFEKMAIKKILTNPVYIGQIVWGRTSSISTIENGQRIKKQVSGTASIIENAHPAIVPREIFDKVQARFQESDHAHPKNTNKHLANPLAGLIFCANCGKALQQRGNAKGNPKDKLIACVNPDCPTRGTYSRVVLNLVLENIRDWCVQYENPEPIQEVQPEPQQEAITHQISVLESQIAKAQELVELGVYTPSEYLQRKEELQNRIQAARQNTAKQIEPTRETIHSIIPEIKNVLEAFPLAQTAEQKNMLLKSIIARIEYSKPAIATKAIAPETLITLTIYPRLKPNGQ